VNLYHYTDQNGFLGILENKEIWATKIQYLNDAKEYHLAKEIAERALKSLLRNPEYKNDHFRIERFIYNLDNYIGNNLCVSSFSEEGDLLSQWRGYSSSQGGYSIGFEKEALEMMINKEGFNLERCIYKELDQVRKVSDVIFESLDRFRGCMEPNQDFVEGSSDSTSYFLDKLSYLSSFIKDSSFSEEKEWRIVALVRFDDLDFRPGKSSIIPYKKIKIEDYLPEVVSDIFIGHTPNPQLATQATTCFLIKHYPMMVDNSFEHPFSVRESKIPYRSW
jgi:hypothetical protein